MTWSERKCRGNILNVTYVKKWKNFFHMRSLLLHHEVLWFFRRVTSLSTCYRKRDLNFNTVLGHNQQKWESQSEVGIWAELKAEHLTAKNSKNKLASASVELTQWSKFPVGHKRRPVTTRTAEPETSPCGINLNRVLPEDIDMWNERGKKITFP